MMALCAVGFSSCSEDEPSVSPNIYNSDLIGKWGQVTNDYNGTLTFYTDGTLSWDCNWESGASEAKTGIFTTQDDILTCIYYTNSTTSSSGSTSEENSVYIEYYYIISASDSSLTASYLGYYNDGKSGSVTYEDIKDLTGADGEIRVYEKK